MNFWEFEVEELLHCVKSFEVNCEEEFCGFILELTSKEEREDEDNLFKQEAVKRSLSRLQRL